ncbi:MAG: hypothetical protein H0U66_00960 [Gemmatimonadaceae bacterium]|nr:hypothetical protein [Gemmatimonadaceae bacterium]
MRASVPPYAVGPISFPFRALAAYAGRAQLGRGREVALACLMAARLSTSIASEPLPAPVRAARATGAGRWFASLALPSQLRASLTRLAAASARESASDLADALDAVITAARKHLDDASLAELDGVVKRLKTQRE